MIKRVEEQRVVNCTVVRQKNWKPSTEDKKDN